MRIRRILGSVYVLYKRRMLNYYPCYLLERDLSSTMEPQPPPPGFTLVVHTNTDTITFSAYHSNGELAHTTKVALTEAGKRTVDVLPYRVDFQGGEVCSGASYTLPKYRRRGLYYYVRSHVFRHLAEAGYSRDLFSVRKDNRASLHTLTKLGGCRVGEGRYIRIAFLTSWKETMYK